MNGILDISERLGMPKALLSELIKVFFFSSPNATSEIEILVGGFCSLSEIECSKGLFL